MNSFKEFLLSFFESAKDRLKNPMIGAFVISWFAINWRIVAVLFFSQKKIEDRINYIESEYLNWEHNLWIPIGIAIFYVLILPHIMLLFDWLSQKGIATRKKIFTGHRISDIQNRQEIAAEEWQLEKIREGSPDIQALKDKIVSLEDSLAEKDEVIVTLSESIENDSTSEKKPASNDSQNLNDTNTKPKSRRKSTTKKSIKDKTDSDKKPTKSNKPEGYPIMKDIVIRDLAKTEREWILIYALYSSNFGKDVITREDISNKYSESNRKTTSRMNNLTNNINNMVKSGQLKFINDDEMLLTTAGIEIATDILNR